MLVNRTTGQVLATRIRICDTFWHKLRGLMFRRRLQSQEAYVFCYGRESIIETSVHMFFCFFPIAVIWLDANKRVVDKKLARPFRPYYASRTPARYFVEGLPGLLAQVTLGDELAFGEGGL